MYPRRRVHIDHGSVRTRTTSTGGALVGKYSPGVKARGLRRLIGGRFRRSGLEALRPVVALLREINERRSASPNQVALRWLLETDGVLPIPGAKNAKQAESDTEALGFALSTAEVEALSEATMRWRV